MDAYLAISLTSLKEKAVPLVCQCLTWQNARSYELHVNGGPHEGEVWPQAKPRTVGRKLGYEVGAAVNRDELWAK